jgi:hypothetical protein
MNTLQLCIHLTDIIYRSLIFKKVLSCLMSSPMDSLPMQVLESLLRVYPGRHRQWKEPGELSQRCSQPWSDSRHRSIPGTPAGEQRNLPSITLISLTLGNIKDLFKLFWKMIKFPKARIRIKCLLLCCQGCNL